MDEIELEATPISRLSWVSPATLKNGFLALACAAFIRFAGLWLMTRHGYIIYTIDESVRFQLSDGWLQHPFWFTHWDGVWMTGGFAYYGLWMAAIHDPLDAVLAGISVGHLLGLLMIYLLAIDVAENWKSAAGVTCLAALGYPFLWSGQGPLVEPIMMPLLTGGVWTLLRMLDSSSGSARHRWALASGALFLLAASMHIIAWLVIVGALAAAVLSIARRPRSEWKGYFPALAIVAGCSAIVPVAWMIGSAHYLHSPFQFLKNQARSNTDYMKLMGLESSVLAPLLVLPLSLLRALWPLLLGLPVVLWVFRSHPKRRGLFFILLCTLIPLAITSVSMIRTGYGASPFRNMIPIYTLALVGCGVPIWDGFLRWTVDKRRIVRGLARLALAAMMVLWFGYHGIMSGKVNQYIHEDFPNDILAMGGWLRQELRHPQAIKGLRSGVRVGFRAKGYQSEHCSLMGYLSGAPRRIISVPPQEWEARSLGSYDYLIVDEAAPIPSFHPVSAFGGWSVYRRDK